MFGLAISAIARQIRGDCARLDFYLHNGAFATSNSMTITDLDAAKRLLVGCLNEIDKRRAVLIDNTPKDMVA